MATCRVCGGIKHIPDPFMAEPRWDSTVPCPRCNNVTPFFWDSVWIEKFNRWARLPISLPNHVSSGESNGNLEPKSIE